MCWSFRALSTSRVYPRSLTDRRKALVGITRSAGLMIAFAA
jgi:hypothetical protein